MYISGNGTYMFTDVNDLNYELFNEIGLGIRSQILYDQDTDLPIQFEGKFIKASIDGSPVYPGRNELVYEPSSNYHLISTLFGTYLDKCIHPMDEDEDPKIVGYIAHYIDDDPNKEKQQVVVKTTAGLICSAFYYQIWLAFYDCIFRIAGYNVDLSNFDFKIEKDKKEKK